jgi:hypothetical protein
MMQPQMTPAEIGFLKSHLKPAVRVFEWGSGGSTVTFGRLVAQWIAIEHDHQWVTKIVDALVKAELAYKVTVRHVPPTIPGRYGQGRPTTFKEMRDYVLAIHDYEKFDVILVDGRARVPCAIQAIPHLSTRGKLLIHDYQRPRYHNIERWLEPASSVGNLASFTLGGSDGTR